MPRLRHPIYLTATKCVQCGDIFRLWRQQNRRKKAGHTKHLYCWKCHTITAHHELATSAVEVPVEGAKTGR